jgi:hypothetical protein
MTSAETGMLVFRNQAGEYFLLPRETLEQGRVPEERTTEVEQVLAQAGDVSGFRASVQLPDGGPDETAEEVSGYVCFDIRGDGPTVAQAIAVNVAYLNGLYAGLQAKVGGR